MSIEKKHGVHKMERKQTRDLKTTAERYAEYHKLNDSPYVATEKTEDLGSRGKMKLIHKECL